MIHVIVPLVIVDLLVFTAGTGSMEQNVLKSSGFLLNGICDKNKLTPMLILFQFVPLALWLCVKHGTQNRHSISTTLPLISMRYICEKYILSIYTQCILHVLSTFSLEKIICYCIP